MTSIALWACPVSCPCCCAGCGFKHTGELARGNMLYSLLLFHAYSLCSWSYSSQPEEAASFYCLVCLVLWRTLSFSLLARRGTAILIICVSLSLNHTKWMTDAFEICSLGSVELFHIGCSRRCVLQSFIVPATHLLKCLQGSAVVTLKCINLTALSWKRNLKPPIYIFNSLMY